ncbi:unnamed protein product [Brassica oleracea]|uniref:Uncharacterized protein n=1 Tax=Brassica oleracea TaxID=3712 RepID=A0A3P6F3S9_BRAOL|nr:unnamed protein product [Brassica oleracea]
MYRLNLQPYSVHLDATRKKSHPLITVTSQSSKVLKSAKLNRRLQVFRSLSAAC